MERGTMPTGRGQPVLKNPLITTRGSIAGKELSMAYTKMTRQRFNAMKILFNSGAKNKEVSDAFGVSMGYASMVKASESFEEFENKRYLQTHKASKKAQAKEEPVKAETEPEENNPDQQVVEHRQTVVVQASHYMLEEQKKTNELLALINNKLGAIIDDLYGIKKEA